MNEDVSKTVRFNSTAQIILIPYKRDFIEEQGSISLWWSREELRKISYRIRFEIMSYAHHEDIPLKQAAKKLYGLKW